MNEDKKLIEIRKSCKIGAIISRILLIICIVGTVLTLVGGVAILTMGPKFDATVAEAGQTQILEENARSFSVLNVDISKISNVQSDVPALQSKIEESPLAIVYGIFCLSIAVILIFICIVLTFIAGTFKSIERSESPFTTAIKKRVVTTLIVVGVSILLTMGFGFALVMGIVTWIVSAIMDYGISLQQQYDETL